MSKHRPCISAIDLTKFAAHGSRTRGFNREAALERKVLSLSQKLREESAARAKVERSVRCLESEVQRLNSHASPPNIQAGANERRKVLRALLLAFHPDKIGHATMLSSTEVAQFITALLEEGG